VLLLSEEKEYHEEICNVAVLKIRTSPTTTIFKRKRVELFVWKNY